jgi:hypothetical protein
MRPTYSPSTGGQTLFRYSVVNCRFTFTAINERRAYSMTEGFIEIRGHRIEWYTRQPSSDPVAHMGYVFSKNTAQRYEMYDCLHFSSSIDESLWAEVPYWNLLLKSCRTILGEMISFVINFDIVHRTLVKLCDDVSCRVLLLTFAMSHTKVNNVS